MAHSSQHRTGGLGKDECGIGSLIRHSQEDVDFKSGLKGDKCGSGERRL